VRPQPPELDFFETAVDVNGVPLFAHRTPQSMDLKKQADGHFTVSRGSASSGAGSDLVLLNDRMDPVGSRRTVGLKNTDGHDAILMPDGTLWLMAYEPRSPDGTGLIDAIVQRIDPDGTVGFQWSSAPYVAEGMRQQNDYAHMNSMQIMNDGDLLLSFRHFSSVWKIATSTHDGFRPGDVVWRLGGRNSDFAFPAGDGGPCAQHTARQLPNGHILMFDNGSWDATQAWCVDPSNPSGPAVQRVQTRIVEWALDEQNGTATVVNSYAPPGWFAVFAGSAQRQANGNTLIGWAEETNALASEIDSSGNLLWQIRDPRATYPYFTYRALKTTVPDAVLPVVGATTPADGASYVEGAVIGTDFACTDQGGSSLQSCDGPETLETATPGTHTATFTTSDGAGNTAVVSRRYTVLPSSGVDASVQVAGTGRWVGQGTVGGSATQRADTKVTLPDRKAEAIVRVTNTGALPSAVVLGVTSRGRAFTVRPRRGLTTPVLAPGQSWRLRLTVERKARAAPEAKLLVTVATSSVQTRTRTDAVSWSVRTGRR
jgi:hypothetical protein